MLSCSWLAHVGSRWNHSYHSSTALKVNMQRSAMLWDGSVWVFSLLPVESPEIHWKSPGNPLESHWNPLESPEGQMRFAKWASWPGPSSATFSAISQKSGGSSKSWSTIWWKIVWIITLLLVWMLHILTIYNIYKYIYIYTYIYIYICTHTHTYIYNTL